MDDQKDRVLDFLREMDFLIHDDLPSFFLNMRGFPGELDFGEYPGGLEFEQQNGYDDEDLYDAY